MYRTALRTASRPAAGCLRAHTLRAAPRRFASTTSPADKSRTWKGSAVRIGLAAAAVYYYNTSTIFMDDGAAQTAQTFTTAPSAFPAAETNLPTVDSIVEERKKQAASKAEAEAKAPVEDKKKQAADQSTTTDGAQDESQAAPGSPAALEEEAGQEGAFNPETGEINWDCPCLGGMAHGPCGEEFKTAFSCFVYSDEEPKGMDCIEKFQGMQECFRQYPEIYGAELADEDDEAGDEISDAVPPAAPKEQQQQQQQTPEKSEAPASTGDAKPESNKSSDDDKYTAKSVEPQPETPVAAMPETAPEKAAVAADSEPKGPKWEDATAANAEVQEQSKPKAEEKKKEEE